ncbi:MAG TPA: hypothetical protein ENI10_09260 [Halomonas sp.]|nr:hypothetical protein [Halomonas sp.]HEB04765.1 hypothetical protein [Halomonas sp.]
MPISTLAEIELDLPSYTWFALTLGSQMEQGRVMEGRVSSRPANSAGAVLVFYATELALSCRLARWPR